MRRYLLTNKFSLLTFIAGLITFVVLPIVSFGEKVPLEKRPSFYLGLATGEIYRHTYAYPAYCRIQGYEMKEYPQKVREKYKKEIDIVEKDQLDLVNRASTNNYKDIEDFYKNTTWKDEYGDAPVFFEAVRKRLILLDVAKEKNIDVEKVVLTPDDDMRETLKSACECVDKDADWFTSVDTPFSYIIDYVHKKENNEF